MESIKAENNFILDAKGNVTNCHANIARMDFKNFVAHRRKEIFGFVVSDFNENAAALVRGGAGMLILLLKCIIFPVTFYLTYRHDKQRSQEFVAVHGSGN